jgi:serine/threonine protein kinase
MGSVWLAYHLTLEVRCAVKFIVDEAVRDPRYRAQFHLEARAIAQIRSPHVVRVLDHDVCDDVPYIAMDFLEGEDLSARLQRVGRLDPRATYRIISQVAQGLGKAHAAGIVHRDLKPENVFLAREDDEEVVKLLDFGIAKLDSGGGQARGLVGTPEYMSPEQTRGVHEVDHRSDLWALAVIAYQCLTGRLPFEAGTLPELFARIMVQSPPLPSEVVQTVPPAVDLWWARGTSRIPEGRFQSARELADAFGEALRIGDAPVRPWRVRRVPVAAAGLIAAVSAVIVLAARNGTSVARADLVDPRPHAEAVTAVMPQPAAEARERGDVGVPAEPVDASAGLAAKRVVPADHAVTPVLRPRSVVAPRGEAPSSEPMPSKEETQPLPPKEETQPMPSKEETEVDFGI